MKRIILFEDLDKLNFYFSLLLIPFFKKIYFREASYGKDHYFFKKKLDKIFFQVGIKDLSGKLINKSFTLKKYLIKKYINNNFNTQIFDEFCKLNTIKYEDKKKLIYSIENIIYSSKFEAIETSSYICIKILFSNNFSYYVPSSENTFLVMKQIKNKNLKIIGATVLTSMIILSINKVLKIFLNKINFFTKRKNIVINNDLIKPSFCKIGYFPHSGLKYGNFFKKTFVYQKSKTSPLYKNNIETLSFQDFDKLTLKYLNFFKLAKTELNKISSSVSWRQIYIYASFFLKNKKFIFRYKLFNLKIFFQLFLSIEKYNKFFKNKNYNYLFFYNDFLIAPGILLSASINQIKTISFQDRLTSYSYNYRCFFDLYLLAGKKFEKIFKNKYLVENYEVLGLTRANLVIKKKISFIENIIEKNFGIITCLLTAPNTNWKVNIHGEDGTSQNSILKFCEHISKLSKYFKNKYFIIKFKLLDPVTNIKLINSINKIISSSDNVILHSENDINSANFIAHSELIIGKYSTILDEALISGKDVLIHDDENYISSLSFLKKNKILIVNNFDELLYKSKKIIERKVDFYKFYVEGKSYYIKNYLTNEGTVGNQKKIVEIIEKYIRN